MKIHSGLFMVLFYVLVIAPFLLGEFIHGSWTPDLYVFLSLGLGVIGHSFLMDAVLRIYKKVVIAELAQQVAAKIVKEQK